MKISNEKALKEFNDTIKKYDIKNKGNDSMEYIKQFIKKMPNYIILPKIKEGENNNIILEWKIEKKDFYLKLSISQMRILSYVVIKKNKTIKNFYNFKKYGIKIELLKILLDNLKQ